MDVLEEKINSECFPPYNCSIEEVKNFKILNLIVIEAKNLLIGSSIVVTPFGVNNKNNKFIGTFVFGKENETNAFNFPKDENVAKKNFQINYEPS